MKVAGSDVEHPLAAWADRWVSSIAYDQGDGEGFDGRDNRGYWLPGVYQATRMLYSAEDVEALRADRERTHELWEDARPAPSRSFWRWHKLYAVGRHGLIIAVPSIVSVELP